MVDANGSKAASAFSLETALAFFPDKGGARSSQGFILQFPREDRKCFILDFWFFPEFRGYGTGCNCFAALDDYAGADGA